MPKGRGRRNGRNQVRPELNWSEGERQRGQRKRQDHHRRNEKDGDLGGGREGDLRRESDLPFRRNDQRAAVPAASANN